MLQEHSSGHEADAALHPQPDKRIQTIHRARFGAVFFILPILWFMYGTWSPAAPYNALFVDASPDVKNASSLPSKATANFAVGSVNEARGSVLINTPNSSRQEDDALPASCYTCAAEHPTLEHVYALEGGKVIDRTLFDMHCEGYCTPYFHLLNQNLLPATAHLAAMVEIGAREKVDVYRHVVLATYWPWFDYVFRAKKTRYNLIGFNQRNTSTYRDTYRTPRAKAYLQAPCKVCLRDLAFQYEGLPLSHQPLPCEYTIYLVRTHSRRLRNYPVLISHLNRVGAPYGVPAIPFFGNESISDTVHLFTRACAIVGTHGAGHTNALSSRQGVLVVEIHTYFAPQNRSDINAPPQPWRSKQIGLTAGMDFDMNWSNYQVEYTYMRPTPQDKVFNASGVIAALGLDWNHYLKTLHMVLDRQHMHNIAALVEAHFRNTLPKRKLRAGRK